MVLQRILLGIHAAGHVHRVCATSESCVYDINLRFFSIENDKSTIPTHPSFF